MNSKFNNLLFIFIHVLILYFISYFFLASTTVDVVASKDQPSRDDSAFIHISHPVMEKMKDMNNPNT